MDTIKFFEKLATNVHHQVDLDSLLNMLPSEVKDAYLNNDMQSLKSQLDKNNYLANESHVVQIQL